ncbi:putative mitochondrial protein [Tanacetum coccineum]
MYSLKVLAIEDDETQDMECLGEENFEEIEEMPQISLNAINESREVSLMRLEGLLVELQPELQVVVEEFMDVFVVPKELPPRRPCDHRISMLEGTTLVNVRPYRHSPTQKDAIESMVQELLNTGVIRSSNSPFALPIAMGHYEFLVIPFGLTNAPSTFQALMNDVFKPFLRKIILVFFDDILIYSKSLQEHVEHLKNVLEVMRQHQLYAKLSECVFGSKQVEYLGHVISALGVATDPSKIKAMEAGLFQLIPLTLLLMKNGFKWNTATQSAFEQLKQAMISAPVLALPNFEKEFIVETDASRVGIIAVLIQGGHLIAYLSKTLSTKHQLMSTYEKEFLAVILALERWRGYLLDKHFKIKTNHFNLKYLLDQRITTPTQMKWLPKLMGFD